MSHQSGSESYQKGLTKGESEESPSTSGATRARPKRAAKKESLSISRSTRTRLKTAAKKESLSTSRSTGVRPKRAERKESLTSATIRARPKRAANKESSTSGSRVTKRRRFETSATNEESPSTSGLTGASPKGTAEKVCIDMNTLHSGSIWMLPKRISQHADIYEGEVRSRNGDTSPIVLKFAENIPQGITEARILAKLNHHSHVLSLIHSGTFNFRFVDQIYIALDKCHDKNLREFVTNRKKQGFAFNLSQAIEIAQQMVDGVKYIHENRIIHKDLKPDNILFSLDQRLIKIADFGLSQEIDSTSTEIFERGQFGTNGFRPPESFGRGIISQKSDIFSLGVTFYFVLSNGEHLFGEDPDGWYYQMMNGIVDLSGLLVSNVKTTEHLIKSMIEQKINDRPTIWQVSEHQFWTGNEVSCDFDYHCPESSVSQIPPTSEEPSHNINDLYLFREHLEKVKLRDEAAAAKAQNEGGVKIFNLPPTAYQLVVDNANITEKSREMDYAAGRDVSYSLTTSITDGRPNVIYNITTQNVNIGGQMTSTRHGTSDKVIYDHRQSSREEPRTATTATSKVGFDRPRSWSNSEH